MDLPQQVIGLDGLTLRRFNAEADLPEFFRVIEEAAASRPDSASPNTSAAPPSASPRPRPVRTRSGG